MRRFYQFLCALSTCLIVGCSAFVTTHNCPYPTSGIEQLKTELAQEWKRLGYPEHLTLELLEQVDTHCVLDLPGRAGEFRQPYTAVIRTKINGQLVPLRETAMVHEWQHYLLYQYTGNAGGHVFHVDGSFAGHVEPWTEEHDDICGNLR